jgi:hypothetical protein
MFYAGMPIYSYGDTVLNSIAGTVSDNIIN